MTKQASAPRRKRRQHRFVVIGIILSIMLMTTGAATSARQTRSSLVTASLSFSPATPTIVDLVRFSVDGEWQNGCTPEFSTLRIFPTDHVVRIDAIANPNGMACAQSVTPYSLQVSTFFDQAGSYQVLYYVQDGADGAAELVTATVIDVKGGLRLSPTIAAVGDPISATVSDIATTTCVPTFYDRTLADNLIYIEVISPANTEGCAAVSTPWSINVPLLDLAPDAYSVQLRITEAGGALSSGRVVYQNQLFVLQTVLRTLLPIVMVNNGVWE